MMCSVPSRCWYIFICSGIGCKARLARLMSISCQDNSLRKFMPAWLLNLPLAVRPSRCREMKGWAPWVETAGREHRDGSSLVLPGGSHLRPRCACSSLLLAFTTTEGPARPLPSITMHAAGASECPNVSILTPPTTYGRGCLLPTPRWTQ